MSRLARNAYTLVEALVVLATIACLIGMLFPALWAARTAAVRSGERPKPPETWLLQTVRHDDHLWVISAAASTVPAEFLHHPDCPCRRMTPEASE